MSNARLIQAIMMLLSKGAGPSTKSLTDPTLQSQKARQMMDAIRKRNAPAPTSLPPDKKTIVDDLLNSPGAANDMLSNSKAEELRFAVPNFDLLMERDLTPEARRLRSVDPMEFNRQLKLDID